jgi:hypothetical protein
MLRPPFQHGGGLLWKAELPPEIDGPGDTPGFPAASRVRLHEDGSPLGPAHSMHSEISQQGRGRYSHWSGGLSFSTSDGSDPNTNRRTYTLSIGAPTLKLLGFGSCHVHSALADLDARGRAYRLWRDPGMTYTPRETLQLIEFHLGLLEIPELVQAVALSTDAGQNSLPSLVPQSDLVFLEFGSGIDVMCGPVVITRAKLTSRVVHPLYALGKAEARIAKAWYHLGLRLRNEAVRRESSKLLLDLIPRADVDQALARELLQNARGHVQPAGAVAETIKRIGEVLGAERACVLGAHNVFMPDGRPMNWPKNFAKDLERICRRLGMPLVQPSRLVAEHGVEFSLEPDRHHFTPRFLALLGEELLHTAQHAVGCH